MTPHTHNRAAIAWLEADYDKPRAFQPPPVVPVHAPIGLYQMKPGHPGDCQCENGDSESWLSCDAAAKWRAS